MTKHEKDIETMKKNQYTISDIKNTPEGIKSKLGEAEDRTSELEDINTQSEQQKEKKNEKQWG